MWWCKWFAHGTVMIVLDMECAPPPTNIKPPQVFCLGKTDATSKQIQHVSKLESHVAALTVVAWNHGDTSRQQERLASADASGKLVIWHQQRHDTQQATTWHEAAVLSRYAERDMWLGYGGWCNNLVLHHHPSGVMLV